MSYVERVLRADEKVLHIARLHWVVYFVPLAAIGAGIVLLSVSLWPAYRDGRFIAFLGALAGLGLTVYGLAIFVVAWIRHAGTELAVTSLRVIVKTGFFHRQTWELNADKVEGAQVNQSVLGRILDYGNVTITGAGESARTIKNIAHPVEFRTHVTLGA